MNEPNIEQPEVQRVNGFAKGDRVAIVNCELAGGYGYVEHSGTGCMPWECFNNCLIVFVELTHKPAGVESDWRRMGHDGIFRFLVSEVTHVD